MSRTAMEGIHPLLAAQLSQHLGIHHLPNDTLQGLLQAVGQFYAGHMAGGPLTDLPVPVSEARFRQIVECSTDLIYDCDPHGYFTYANPVACRTFGCAEEEVRTLHFSDVVAPEHRDMVRTFYKRQFQERTPDTYLEFKNLTRTGRTLWTGHNVHLYRDAANDRVLGFQGVARDLTEAKQAEETLIEARRLAEESARAKEHFLSVMSHEIRTPLNSVIGLSHLLLDENPLPSQVDHLQAIKHSADSLMVIINDILDFSKIESGKVTFENIEFRLDDIFKGIEKSLSYRTGNTNLRLLVNTDPRLPAAILGDPLRLNQILLNLVGNAVKFTEKGYVEVKAHEVSRTPDTITVEFKVSDTGIGIAPDKLDSVFDSFSQTSLDTTRKYGGTGLGLAITKRLVELQGGLVHVKSKLGLGSTFTVLLTFGVPAKRKAVPPAAHLPDAAPAAALHNASVLLVEDNRMNQLVVKKFLEKWGVRMHLAENGIEAIEVLREQAFDVVLMDLQMPQMDGYKAARYIRYNLDAPVRHVPIVALTASAMMDVRRKVLDAGMNDFITKPFDPRDLYLKILKFTHRGARPDDHTLFTAPLMPASSGYVNLQYLEEISANNTEFITDMLRLFLRQMPHLMQKLKLASSQAHWAEMRQVVHQMKSSLATVGIFELESVMRQLETYAAQESNLAETVQLGNHLERVCGDVYRELRERLTEQTGR